MRTHHYFGQGICFFALYSFKQNVIGNLQEEILEQKRLERENLAEKKKKDVSLWKKKLHTSPFLVDLVAESERADEENRVRLKEEMKRQSKLVKRKEMVKGEIILQALSEVSDLEALRQEKRNILAEEKRLKALLDLEKAKTKRKQDLLTAQRAEKERKAAAGSERDIMKYIIHIYLHFPECCDIDFFLLSIELDGK
jgi:hypothetical protein